MLRRRGTTAVLCFLVGGALVFPSGQANVSAGPGDAAALALGSGQVSTPLAKSMSAPATPPLTEEQIFQISVRERFGLDTRPDHIHSLGELPYSWMGIPLTASEEQEMERRNVVAQESFGPIERLLQTRSSATFAGVRIDNEAGGVVVVSTTNEASLPLTELRALLPTGTALRVQPVRHSEIQLRQLQSRLKGDMGDIATLGIVVVGYSYAPEENVVEVLLTAGSSQSDADLLLERYSDAPGLAVRILNMEFDNVVDRTSGTGALYGGRKILGDSACTNGLSAKGAQHGPTVRHHRWALWV